MGDALSLLDEPRQLPREQLCLLTASAAAKKKKRRHKHTRPTSYKTREQICRDTLESLTRLEWPSVRPRWLLGQHGRALECDAFCERLSAAVECSGEYHDHRMACWQTQAQWEQTRRNDLIKASILQRLGFLLIVVPSRRRLGDHAIPQFLVDALAKHRVLARAPIHLPT